MNKKREALSIGIAALIFSVCNVSTTFGERSTYIVHMDESEMPASFESDHAMWYESSLMSLSNTTTSMIYTYNNVIRGYAATLTPDEARTMASRPDVLSVMPEIKYELHTTRSPWFLGLEQDTPLLPNPALLSDVIVGVLDSGVWPESKSFDDTSLGPIPSRWKGYCEVGTDFNKSHCNKKLIGARFFLKGYEKSIGGKLNQSSQSRSPRDNQGHGTHTSTTIAGSPVSGASFFGYANGTARGITPQARIAMYKCCWIPSTCVSSDVLAAMDKAIEDGVDVLSLSLSAGVTIPYDNNCIAIGAFAAMEKGIFVACSAGNDGPSAPSVANVAPWITTVGAGTLDRQFPSPVTLGNGKNFDGVSLYSDRSLGGKFLPFVYAGNATNDTHFGRFCLPGTLIPEKVKGKIVLCDPLYAISGRSAEGVKAAGGLATIMVNTREELEVFVSGILATTVGVKEGEAMRQYLSTDPNATAAIFIQGTKLGVQPAPMVAGFSSRGPNFATPEILKPDLIAPGVSILAGWAEDVGPSDDDDDTRRVPYNILSGTSMSCPHVSGLAAIMKAAHPKWSPAAIRSALMTTAYTTYKDGSPILDAATGKPSTPFDHGAGHVNPISAIDPGLVYDLKTSDYLEFLCAINYTAKQIMAVAGGKTSFACKGKYYVSHLNYPSFVVTVQANPKGNAVVVTHKRQVTNVGEPGTYEAKVISPSQAVKINVNPWKLSFNLTNEVKSYQVTFEVNPKLPVKTNLFGRIEWRDGNNHVVGSPIAISWV